MLVLFEHHGDRQLSKIKITVSSPTFFFSFSVLTKAKRKNTLTYLSLLSWTTFRGRWFELPMISSSSSFSPFSFHHQHHQNRSDEDVGLRETSLLLTKLSLKHHLTKKRARGFGSFVIYFSRARVYLLIDLIKWSSQNLCAFSAAAKQTLTP